MKYIVQLGATARPTGFGSLAAVTGPFPSFLIAHHTRQETLLLLALVVATGPSAFERTTSPPFGLVRASLVLLTPDGNALEERDKWVKERHFLKVEAPMLRMDALN